MRRGNSKAAILSVVLVGGMLATAAHAYDWTHWAGDAAHSSTAPHAPVTLDNIAWSAVPETLSGELEDFIWRGGVVVADDRVFITGRRYADDGTGLWEHTANIVICYDAHDGTRLWDEFVDADIYEYDSWATPVVDQASNTVIVASHFSLFALDLSDGEIQWECELPEVLVNASPTLSSDLTNVGVPANRVFITDYTGFTANGGGIYAVNISPYDEVGNPYEPGEIVWQDRTLSGTSGNTVAYADGFVYVATTQGGEVRAYAALDGGTPSLDAVAEWETETGISETSQYAGFYGGIALHAGSLYVAGYNFYGTGNTSRLYKLNASDGIVLWEQPCERSDSMPVVDDDGRIYLSAGIEGFGSAVKIQAFEDHGTYATELWDTYVTSEGDLMVGGWTHQPLLADGLFYCGTPDESQFFAPYTNLYILDLSLTPTDAGFVVENVSGSGGSPASTGRYLYSLGSDGLVAYRNCGGGDMDADGDIDTADFAAWGPCMNGPEIVVPPAGCDADAFECADVDYDDDVDMCDFVNLQQDFGQGS